MADGFRLRCCCRTCVLVLLTAVLPRLERDRPFTLDQLPVLLRNRALVVVYAVTVLMATGYYAGYSYIDRSCSRWLRCRQG